MGKEKCYECGELAQWYYLPGGGDPKEDYFCDNCVPRGCSCNKELKEGIEELIDGNQIINPPEDFYEPVDEQGRKYPCCEFMYSEQGYDLED